MPFFTLRRGGSSSVASGAAAQPASAEVLRKRARHRLIGAAVLVLLGVVGFPLLFDTQPRPIPVDIPIVIPGKANVPPLGTAGTAPSAPSAAVVSTAPPTPATVVAAAPEAAPTPTPAATARRETPEKVAAAASLDAKEEIVRSRPVEPPPAAPKPKPEAKPEHKPEAKPVAKPAVVDDGARARALLNGGALPPAAQVAAAKPATADAADARFIVQVGAFAETAKAQEVRMKVERTGLKTYAQVADTKDGKRTRVRVGPFSSRAEAEKAAGKIRGLDLPAAILTL